MSDAEQRPLERARAIAPLLAEEALASEQAGAPTERAAEALVGSGLFGMLLPLDAGGLAASRTEFFRAVEAVARADGSAGWSLSVGAAISDFTYRGLGEAGRAEVYGEGPPAFFTSLLPRGRETPVDGGYRLSGRYSMGSGSALARWVVVPATIGDRDGKPWQRAFVLPKAQADLEPGSWDVMGLRATASLDYEIRDRFVPERRTFAFPFLQTRTPGSISSIYGIQLNQIGLTAFACGVGRRALDELIEAAPRTRRTVGEGVQAEDHMIQYGVGDQDGRLRAARAFYLQLVAEQDARVAADGAPSGAVGQKLAQAAQILVQAARTAAIFAFDHAPAQAVYARHPIQRCVRDLFTGLKHASFTPAMLTRAGRERLGIENAVVPLP
jgi:indole-3-acetate monooxygenase